MKKTSITYISLLLAIAAVSFYGGMNYQQARSRRQISQLRGGQPTNRPGQPANTRFRQSGGGVFGEVISLDDKSITVKINDGSSKIVLLSSGTNVSRFTPQSVTDIKISDKVAVFGTPNQDGSLTAQSIQLDFNPPPASQN